MKKRLLTTLVVFIGIFLLSASIVWAQAAPVPQTGQITSYVDGDDGDLQKGVVSPDPRFTDNADGTVTDNLTGLMWSKNANLNNGQMNWNAAIAYANNLTLGSQGCGTSYTDWRLPNRNELTSLIDSSNINPALPSDHPFSNVQSNYYWSSTTVAYYTLSAWLVGMYFGFVGANDETLDYYVWPVRSDN